MLPKQDISWWFWLSTIPLLTAGLLGEQRGMVFVIMLTGLQAAFFYWQEKHIAAFRVQVRIAYFFCLLTGLLPYMEWLLWLQLTGTCITVLTDYCLMARLVSLAPWNRDEQLNRELIRKTVLSKPVNGSIIQPGYTSL